MNPNQRPTSQQPNPSLQELQAIRKELSAVATELADLRKDLKSPKTLSITDSVAKGVVIGNLLLVAVMFVLALLVGRA